VSIYFIERIILRDSCKWANHFRPDFLIISQLFFLTLDTQACPSIFSTNERKWKGHFHNFSKL